MSAVTVCMYDSVAAYENESASSRSDMQVTLTDLQRYCITSGGFSTREVSPVGQAFYAELVRMALEEDAKTGKLITRDDYTLSEKSIKSSISFFLGMVAARAFAEKRLRMPFLFHLKDRRIVSSPMDGPHPDFFGEDLHGRGILIEAKGTCGTRVGNQTMRHAVDEQLAGVTRVRDEKAAMAYEELKGYAIGLGFERGERGGEAVISCVDPTPQGSRTLPIDLDTAMYAHYGNVLSWFRLPGAEVLDYEAHMPLVLVRVGQMVLGIDEHVYKVMSHVNRRNPRGLYRAMMRLANRRMERQSADVAEGFARVFGSASAIGLDGVMVALPISSVVPAWNNSLTLGM